MPARAALLLFLLPSMAAGQSLATLFHTPAEREALNRLRHGEPVAETKAPPARPVITGHVKRSDGKGTVFLDGQPRAMDEPAVRRPSGGASRENPDHVPEISAGAPVPPRQQSPHPR